MGKGKKKGNKQDAQGKSSNQVEPASNSKSEHQQKKEEVQQQQDKQTEQLFLVQSDMPPQEENTIPNPVNLPHHSNQQSSIQNPQPAQMDPSKPPGKGKQNKVDWKCIKCSHVNFAKKAVCKNCDEPKPAPPEPPKEVPQEPQTSNSLVPSLDSLKISTISVPSSKIETNSEAKKLYEGTRGKKCNVEVNYVELNLKKLSKICFHYDVAIVPDTPKKMLPDALDEFMRKLFKDHLYAFDGRNNMITYQKLDLKIDEFSEKVEAHFGDRKKTFDITVKLVSTDSMEALQNYKNNENSAKANQNLDIILKSVFRHQIDNGLAVRAGRNLFFVPDVKNDLGEGMELWYGLFQAAILGRAKIYLNIDVLHKAFPSPVHLLEYIRIFDRNRPQRIPESLDPQSLKKLTDFLKMLTIGYRLSPTNPLKTYGFNGLRESASKASFEWNGKKITVKEYFEKENKIKLRFPNLPLLWVGSKTQSILLPIEFCELPPGQVTNKTCSKFCISKLTRLSVTKPEVRKNKIQGLMDRIPYNMDPTIKGFGIEVGKTFQNVDARVIDPPNLKYKNKIVKPFNGIWNAETFLEVKQNKVKWCILHSNEEMDLLKLDVLKKDLMHEARMQNLDLEDCKSNDIIDIRFAGNKNKVIEKLIKLKDLGYQFVVAVISNDKDYQVVKHASELCVGILTTCIMEETIMERLGGRNATVKNIILKLNSKLKGKSHEIDESSFKAILANSGVMFVGADVTHPSPDQKNIPSVVGVVSSYDQFGTKYFPAWRLQQPTVEMIQDLENILVEHLHIYRAANKKFPQKIMYYRDGVSDSQFSQVLDIEMTAIRKALIRIYGLNKPAEVTFVVIQKRHHTRFFPTDSKFAIKNGNILPGTVVDKDIVHPFQFQFFLASHTAIQGVTKPSKYCILVNESKISADDIQAITYDLCHLFSRCSKSVSYPAPTYYAHLLADRAKKYFDEDDLDSIMQDIDSANQQHQNNPIHRKFVRENPMFFI